MAFLVGEFGGRLLNAVKERSETFYQPDAVLYHSFVPGKAGVGLCTTGNEPKSDDAKSLAPVW